MSRKLISAVLITLFFSAQLYAEPSFNPVPFKYSRSTKIGNRELYFNNQGKIVGQSNSTKTGTYWYNNNKMIGRSFSTGKNTYFMENK